MFECDRQSRHAINSLSICSRLDVEVIDRFCFLLRHTIYRLRIYYYRGVFFISVHTFSSADQQLFCIRSYTLNKTRKINKMLGRSSVIARNFSQSMVRFSGHGGVPGEVSNVPDDGIVWLHNLCLALANPDGKSIIYNKLHKFLPAELALQPAEQVQDHCSVHHRLCFGLWLPLPDRQTSAVEEVNAPFTAPQT